MPQTGATRYQKFLKSEKAKTKLKSKKDLPKGTNVTKTNFKIKKIVIKEQLKKHNEKEALSTRKLNVKELLSRLGHFNANSRTDALDGLKEIIIAYPDVLEQNLGQFIHAVTPMILIIEKMVRHKSFEVLHLLLLNSKTEKVTPFFNILSTYLRSAMTHIDSRIQEDSLLFLDTILICHSEILAQNFHKIMPNFMDMISKLHVDSKTGRTLTINLSSQITSAKWRIKVLQRLKDFLNKFVDCNKKICNQHNAVIKTQVFDDGKLNYYPIINTSYVAVCHLPCFSSTNSQYALPINEEEKFQAYIVTLMPLLFETWLEVCPNANTERHTETVISEDGTVLLKHILKIITLLWDLALYVKERNPNSDVEKIFCQKYQRLFTQNFVQMFPYITNVRLRQTNSLTSGEKDIDPKLITENLEICYLFLKFSQNIKIKNHEKEVTSVLNYIEKTVCQKNNDNVNNVVIKILNTIFSDKVTYWSKNLSILDGLLSKIISTYFNKDMSNLFTDDIFNVLCKVALNDKLIYFHKSSAYEKWLQSLPNILLKESISVQTIDIIHKFGVRSNSTFNQVIRSQLINIIENLPKIVVPNSESDSNSYHKLFSLLYWVKCWDEKSLNLLETQLLNSVYKSDHGKFIFETLRLRSGKFI